MTKGSNEKKSLVASNAKKHSMWIEKNLSQKLMNKFFVKNTGTGLCLKIIKQYLSV